jgi:beta-lactamase regulating signal transducer with metallopeptidase domain
MNIYIETLNVWGREALRFAWPMFWQSSVLIALLFALDYALRRKVRAAIRYALWCLVLVKLVLPPSLALPTSIAWWLRQPTAVPATASVDKQSTTRIVTPTHSNSRAHRTPTSPVIQAAPVATPISGAAWTLTACSLISLGLFFWLCVRWRQVMQLRRSSVPISSLDGHSQLNELFESTKHLARARQSVSCRLIDRAMSPAVCGLFRPVILLPRLLANQLPTDQLRTILLHELIHLRRRDVWMNCLQALLQIVYWWHPLLWLANARMRRLREETVDDAVMLALADQSDAYAPTLLEVAKLAFSRPLTGLGLVGILESRRGLRQRIERLMNFKTPRRAGLSVMSLVFIAAVSALAVPMAEAPPKHDAAAHAAQSPVAAHSAIETPVNASTQPTANSNKIDLLTGDARDVRASNASVEVGTLGIISADTIDVNMAQRTMTAKGNVEIRAKGVTVHADSLVTSVPYAPRTAESKTTSEPARIAGEDHIQLAAAPLASAASGSGRTSINPGQPPPQINIEVKFIEVPDSSTNLFMKWFALDSPSTGACTTVLSPSRAREFLAELSKPGAVKLLSKSQVTTLSGREAQVEVVDVKTFAMGISNGVSQTEKVPLGPTLDVIPIADADGHTIQMKVTPTLVEFLGYDDPGAFVVQAQQNSNSPPLIAQLPLPHFRVRQVTLSTNVWDGHTLVIYGMPAKDVVRLEDKLPVLGDLPLVGRLFRSETKGSRSKYLIVLVTPTLIDAAGNRVNRVER